VRDDGAAVLARALDGGAAPSLRRLRLEGNLLTAPAAAQLAAAAGELCEAACG